VARLDGWVASSVAATSRRMLGADPPAGPAFIRPVIVVDPVRRSPLARQELFGPVAGAWVFRDEAEGLAMAARSRKGLAGYVMTRDVGRIARATQALSVGVLGVNDAAPTTPEAPFGGLGASGWGKEGGRLGMEDYIDRTFVSIRLPHPAAMTGR